MSIDFSGVGKFLKSLSFLDGFGMVDSVIGLASMIFNYANADWEDHPTTDEIMDEIGKLSDKIDTLAPSIIDAVNDLINDQVIGIRMQQLASAVSGGQSARDLLSSYRPGDEAMRTAIIVEASGAFRDTLAQAVAIATPSEAYDPSFEAINTSMAAVMQALTTRLSVAVQLEKNDLAADKIRNQVLDAADFFEDAIGYYRAAIKTRESNFELEQVDDGTVGGTTNYHFRVELDIDREYVEVSDGQFVRLPAFRYDALLEGFEFSGGPEQYLEKIERDLEDQAFADLDMGFGGSRLTDLAVSYRALADGVELTLPSLIGYDNSGTLTGSDGKDLLIGNDGDDRLTGGNGNDMLRGEAGDDTLLGEDGNDRLIGGAGNDVLLGGRGEDTFEGNGGNDVIFGDIEPIQGAIYALADFSFDKARFHGVRSDFTVEYSHSEVVLVIDTILINGIEIPQIRPEYQTVLEVFGPDGIDKLTGVEQLFFDNQRVTVFEGSNFSDTHTGDASEDIMIGRGGDDILNGAGGNDTMIGGAGNDTYYVDNAGDKTIELAGQGTDSVFSTISYFLWNQSQHIETLTLTGAGNIDGGGNGLANTITGNAGNNSLNGGANADRMVGGAGNDIYFVDNVGDTTIEVAGQGSDNVFSSVSYFLWDQSQHIETLTLTGAGNINAGGNGLANIITGNAGNNVLNGGGNADRMVGGAGNDTYHVDNAGDTTIEVAGQGTDTVISSVSYLLWEKSQHIENLTLIGTANINGGGNGLANTLTGNAGNNVLNGGGGVDRMVGGLGNDTYYVDNFGDMTIELAGQGTDLVMASVGFALRDKSQFIENLTLDGTGHIYGTGNGLANTITGNAGNNGLNGAWGNDTLIGGAGNDIFRDDAGNDIFTGGTGADTFFFLSAGESDRITDFENGIDTMTIGLGVTSFANITVTDSGADAILTFGTNTVTLENFDHALVSSDDFTFV
jgi:Ca2+-binding RTX toxin-like protein